MAHLSSHKCIQTDTLLPEFLEEAIGIAAAARMNQAMDVRSRHGM